MANEDIGRSPEQIARTAEDVKVPQFRFDGGLTDLKIPNFRIPTPTADSTNVHKIQFNLSTPEFEEMLAQSVDALTAAGYDQETIDNLTLPHGIAKPITSDIQLGKLYQTMNPVFEANRSVVEEAWKIAGQATTEDGVAIGPMQWSLMRNLVGIYHNESLNAGGKGVAGMSEARQWWKKLHRAAGDKLADTVAEGVMDFSLGLSLLDMFSFVNKKTKMLFVPPGTDKATLEARILPKIILDNGREFRTGTSAGMWVVGQRMWGLGEKAMAIGIRSSPIGLASLLPNSPLKDIVDTTASGLFEKGQERQGQAVGQVPSLVASLGEHLSWQEVVERNWDPVVDMDDWYAGLNDMGLYGEITMGAYALGNVLAEVVMDPLMLFGSIQAKAPAALRSVAGRLAPGKTAKIISEVARRTNRFEDAIDAVEMAQKDLASAQATMQAQAQKTGGQVSRTVSDKVQQKLAQLKHEEQWMERFMDAGPSEQIILRRTARRSPDALPPLRTTERYVDLIESTQGPVPSRAAFPIEEQQALFKEIKELRKALPDTHPDIDGPAVQDRLGRLSERLGKLGVLSDEEALNVGNLVRQRGNLKRLSENVVKGKPRNEVLSRVRDVNRQIDDILEKGRRSFVLIDKVEKTRLVPREIGDVAEELHAMRRAALEREHNSPIDWNNVDDLPLFQQRQILGPDDAEQAGDAIEHMVRTGGVGIDDVAITPTAIEYAAMPQSKAGLIDHRALNLQNDIVKAEREFGTISSQYDLFTSSRKTLARQIHVTRKTLGLLRSQKKNLPGNTLTLDKIKVYETELENLKTAVGKLKNTPKDKIPYDDIWATPPQDAIMSTPERFNKWLGAAGDRVIRSLYPGGMVTSGFGDTRVGQIIAPIREPQRFMETYDPALWDRVRSGYLRYQQQQRAFYDESLGILENAGVMTKRGKFNPAKDWATHSIDKSRNEQLFDLLDSMPGTPEHTALMEAADAKLVTAHDKIRVILDHAADLQGISDTNKYLTGYIRHAVSMDQFAGGARPIEYIGLPTKADVFASHLLDRTGGAAYPRDAAVALDFYGRAMYRKITMEPLYDDLIRSGGDLAKKHNNPMFQTYMNDMVHSLKGKPQFMGRKVDEAVGGAINKDGKGRWIPGAIDRALAGLSGLVYTGALGANPRYAQMQIATGIATTAGRFGLMRTSRGVWEMATPEGQKIAKEIGTYQPFLDIFESDFMRKATNVINKRAYALTPFGPMSTGMTEEYIRGVTAHAAIDMYMTKLGLASWEEARAAGMGGRIAFEALRASEEVNHMFGALGRSPWGTRTFAPSKGVAISATQFLSFMPKQTEELLSQMSRSPGKLVEYMAVSGWVSRLAAEQLGIDYTSYVGLGYSPETPSDLSAPAVDMFMKTMDLASAMSRRDPQKVSDAVTEFLGSAQVLIPAIVAFESAGKASEQVSEGEQKTRIGEKVRPLDFTLTLPQVEPSSDPRFTGLERFQKGGAQGFAESIRPSADPTRAAEDPAAGLGGDLLPTIMMQRNIRENVFRRGQQAAGREKRRFAFNLTTAVRKYIDAIEEGDSIAEEELLGELENTYRIRITGSDPITRAAQAREISWTMRQILQNEALLDRFMQVYENFGMEVTP